MTQVDCGLQALDGMLSEEGLNDLNLDMAQELLDHGVLLVEKLRREYEEAKNVGKRNLISGNLNFKNFAGRDSLHE